VGAKVEEWELEDPSKKSPEEVRGIRDEIRARVEALVAKLRGVQAKRAGVDSAARSSRS